MEEVTKVLPAIALRGTTILPDMIVHFDISRPKSVRAVEEAMLGNQKIFLITTPLLQYSATCWCLLRL